MKRLLVKKQMKENADKNAIKHMLTILSLITLPIIITNHYFPSLIYFSGLLTFLGHIFPVWIKFKGGKGVATLLGIVFALSLPVTK